MQKIIFKTFVIYCLIFYSVNASDQIYDKFRYLFGNVSVLQPKNIDKITSNLLSQASCNQRLGTDCSNVKLS